MPKFISKIFKKNKKDFSFEEILQEATLQKYGTQENKLYLRINSFGIYFLFFTFFSISLWFLYNAYILQIKDFAIYDEKSKNNQLTFTPIFPIRGNIIDRNNVILAKSEKVGTSSEEYERWYIEKEGFGHILGYTTPPQKDSKGKFWQENFKGIAGIEEYYDLLLRGVPGKEYFEINAKGVKEKSFITEKPVQGKDIILSIDEGMQEKAYQTLKTYVNKNGYLGGSALMMNIENGEILFLTNYPEYSSYKINSTATNSNEYVQELQKSENNPFLNRAISGLYAPGSIVKPVFGLAALQTETISPNTYIFSPGFFIYTNSKTGKKTTYKDWKAHGSTNIVEAIAVSSDVFFYTISGGSDLIKGMGIKTIDLFTKAFKMDQKIGIDLFGEKAGNVPTPEWKMKTFNEEWYDGDTIISSIGQFGFLMTPLEALTMTALIANEGEIYTPHLVKKEEKQDENFKTKVNIDIKNEWYKMVKNGMHQVVANDIGTAKTLNMPFTKMAAKTGTAEFGKNKEYIHSWVVGFFPYDKPKYAFVFMMEKSKANKPDPATLVARDFFWWMWENKKEYFTE